MSIIEVTDLPTALQSADSIELMVAGANARAARVAPCLTWDGTVTDQPVPTTAQLDEARLILLGAIKRWVETGSGAFQQQTAGPFGITTDTRQRTGYNLWPSEIEGLQGICSTGGTARRAFDVNTFSAAGPHMPWCSLLLGGVACSCGANLTRYEYPLYEGGALEDTY